MDVQDDRLVVYTPATDPSGSMSVLSKLFGSSADESTSTMTWIGKHTKYLPMMRFTLVNEEKRLFAVLQWCFRGGIDGWHFLARPQALETYARKYLPHLNKESFYDLM